MTDKKPVFRGCIPALMTPCCRRGQPDYEALVRKGLELITVGMRAVVYCGSMGDWPLLTDAQRQEGVRGWSKPAFPSSSAPALRIPQLAAAHAAHAREVGAGGLDGDPSSPVARHLPAAQRAHFAES